MDEYIKREDAIKAVCDSSAHTCDLKNCFRGCQEAQAILAIPAANVKPVVRGHWIEDGSGVIYCSECGEEHEWLEYRASFCDQCGADMREGGGS